MERDIIDHYVKFEPGELSTEQQDYGVSAMDYSEESDDLHESSENEYAQLPIKSRRRFSSKEQTILEKSYDSCRRPTLDVKKALASKLETTPKRIQIWFQNRRAKEKKSSSDSKPSEGNKSDKSSRRSSLQTEAASSEKTAKPISLSKSKVALPSHRYYMSSGSYSMGSVPTYSHQASYPMYYSSESPFLTGIDNVNMSIHPMQMHASPSNSRSFSPASTMEESEDYFNKQDKGRRRNILAHHAEE
ncbi:hypothetical protein BDB01DRAFT_103457 [Pilobolus umbonatus]|nr:hypothetical protein BDB01DRAFT_103457 [Pilobolus umbonatus]